MIMYPKGFTPQIHNVVEIGGYVKPDDGATWLHSSRNFLFSTGAVAQVAAAQAWSNGQPPYNHFSRLVSLVDVDSTNSYVVSVQRVDAGTWDVSYGAGTTAMGPTNDFTSSLAFTNLLDTDNVGDATFRPAYKLRKHAWTLPYWPAQATVQPSAHEWFQWHLATNTGSLTITNLDVGSGGAVSWANAASAMGASTDTYLKLHLFDRTNDIACFADAFSAYYNFVTRRVYAMPNYATTNGNANVSSVYAELWEPYVSSTYLTNVESVAVAGTTTDYTGQKALRVQGAGWEDLHLSEALGSNRVSTLDTFTSDALYALYRSTNAAFKAMKLIGGYGATNGNYRLTLATNRIAATISGISHTNYSFTVADWPSVGVKKTGWYRFHNPDHETEYYVTNFTGSTAKWKLDALIGTASVTNAYTSGNLLTNDHQSLPVLAYPKRWTGLSFANEAQTVHFRGNCTNSPARLTRTDGDTPDASTFTDEDGDGWFEARIYDFGNGDEVEVPAEATLYANGTAYKLSANVEVTVTVPSNGKSGIAINGSRLPTTSAGGLLTATVPASLLTGSEQDLTVEGTSVPSRRNAAARPSL